MGGAASHIWRVFQFCSVFDPKYGLRFFPAPDWIPACVRPYGPPELSQSGMITQQQLRTSPVVARMTNVVILFLEFHKSEIRFTIPTRSVGCGAWFEFISFFHPYR